MDLVDDVDDVGAKFEATFGSRELPIEMVAACSFGGPTGGGGGGI